MGSKRPLAVSKQEELASLHAEIGRCFERLGAGEELDAAECAALMQRIEALVPSLDPSQMVDLKRDLDQLIEEVTARLEHIETELKQVQQSKKGLKGYSHIRSYGTQQRLCRTA